jgi:hypothetical protein
MSLTTSPLANACWWTRFWHQPVRGERLALVRICLALALLTDQLIQYLPCFADLYGPDGVGYAGLHDGYLLRTWHWTILLTGTDDLAVLGPLFWVWVTATVVLLVGWLTRVMSVAVWFLTMCFLDRNPNATNYGDSVLSTALFLLMFMPTGRAFSIDAWRRRRKALVKGTPPDDPAISKPTVPAWGVRLLQLQLCIIYLTTGLAKLRGNPERLPLPFGLPDFNGMWWHGTALHYVLNDLTLARISYAQLPLPFWMTATLSYVSLLFETFFPLLVLWRPTRKWTLWFGVLFHLGIFLAIEVGWFSFYTLSLYGAWVPGEFWDRRFRVSQTRP